MLTEQGIDWKPYLSTLTASQGACAVLYLGSLVRKEENPLVRPLFYGFTMHSSGLFLEQAVSWGLDQLNTKLQGKF